MNTKIVKTQNTSHIKVPLVRSFGGATSDALLDSNIQVFQLPILKGFIGYTRKGRYAIVFGDPVCSFESSLILAKAFHYFAKKNHLEVIYIGASKPFAKLAIEQLCSSLIEFGGELIVDPFDNPKNKSGPYGSLIRRKVKQALRANITIHEYIEENLELEKKIQNLAKSWLHFRKGLQIHISGLHLFSHRMGKRWFYAKQNNEIIGILTLNELKAKKGWLLNHVMVKPNTFKGVSEFLIISTIEILKEEKCHFVSFGMIAAKELKEKIGLNFFSIWISNFIFKSARKIFDLNGLNTFWKKFQPTWEPTYILFSNRVSLRSIFSILFSLKGSLQKEKL